MPRFLDTFTGKFLWVTDPSTVTYAILSHTWAEGGEQTYDEVWKLWQRVEDASQQSWGQIFSSRPTSILSHPDLSDKIKGFCKAAREAGYKLAWMDACCIDKSSSAELAEAINSMFDLYRLADRCYVYLADVSDCDVDSGYSGMSAFWNSRWHTRGWTLQELIAPKDVMFFTASWTLLGTKISLLETLYRRTDIDRDILLGTTPLSSISVARKMSWAAFRQTTRVEDEAYSLLGIFGAHLSPIYGEGRNAFLRLQEEIVKTTPDQSIFAWGLDVQTVVPQQRGRTSWTFQNKLQLSDAAHPTQRASECKPIEYPPFQLPLSTNHPTSVALAGTNYAEDQPVHLRVCRYPFPGSEAAGAGGSEPSKGLTATHWTADASA